MDLIRDIIFGVNKFNLEVFYNLSLEGIHVECICDIIIVVKCLPNIFCAYVARCAVGHYYHYENFC